MKKICQKCGGTGCITIRDLYGYVTHDMASDAGEPEMEGQRIYRDRDIDCDECDGTGFVEEVKP